MADRQDHVNAYYNLALEERRDRLLRLRENEVRRERAFRQVTSLAVFSFWAFWAVFFLTFLVVFSDVGDTTNVWHLAVFPAMMGMFTVALFVIASRFVYTPRTEGEDRADKKDDSDAGYLGPVQKGVEIADKSIGS